MDARVQTGSFGAESRCQFHGLMKYCPDGSHDPERLLHRHSPSRTLSWRAMLDLTKVAFVKPDAPQGPSTCQTEEAMFKEQKEVMFISFLSEFSNRRFFLSMCEFRTTISVRSQESKIHKRAHLKTARLYYDRKHGEDKIQLMASLSSN